MPHELARLVELRLWREQQAQRALSARRVALAAAEQQRARDQQALRRIEDSARDARNELCNPDAPVNVAHAHLMLAYAASRRHHARDATLRVRRADAEVATAEQQVQAARDAWQQRASAHTKMQHQSDTLARTTAATALRCSEDASADEHLDSWIVRHVAA